MPRVRRRAAAAAALLVLALAPSVPPPPASASCGPRSLGSANFERNARVNLERGARLLETLRRLRAPRELAPVVEYARRSLAWSLWLDQTKLEFYRTWDAGVLRRPYAGLDPGAPCGAVLEALERAPGHEAKYRLGPHPLDKPADH